MAQLDEHYQITVYHVDDDSSQLYFTKTFLEKTDSRLKIVSFESCEEMISRLGDSHDIILSDFQMEKIDGIQICEKVKAIEDIPFILYTARGSEDVAQKAFETGVDDYIRKELKPSHYQVLAKRIIQAVEKHRLDKISNEYKNRLEALHKYTYQIASASTLEDVAEKAFEAINETLEFSYGGIHFIEGNMLVEKFTLGPGPIESKDLPLDGPGVIVRTANLGKTQRVPDTRKDKDYTPWTFHDDLLSELAVPIILNGKVEGVVNVESQALNAFSDEDERLIETLASHIASAFGRLKHVQSLIDSENKIQELLDSSMEAAYVLSGTSIVYVNKKGAELLGYDDPAELVSQNGYEMVSPKQREKVSGIVSSLMNKKQIPHRYKIGLLRKDGSEIQVDTNISHIEYNGKPALLSFIREASERESYELKFRKLYESSVRIFTAKTKNEVCRIVLDSLESIFGFDYGSIGLVEDDKLRFVKTLGFESQGNFTRPLTSKSVSTRTVRTGKIQIIHDISQDPDYFVPISDVETGKKMKSELAVPIRENGRVLGVINVESMYEFPFEEYEIKLIETLAMYAATALGRLEEKANIEQIIELKKNELIQADRFASLGKVTSMVAHDLSNPLQTIRNSTYFLDKDEDGHVSRIIKAVDFASQILEDIKTHTVDTPLKRVLTDLGEIIENSIEQVRVPDNIEIEASIDEELGPISIDPVKIRRMLVNLIKNAIEATTEGGKVRVIAGHHKGGVEIRVEDNGVGISKVIQEALFTQVITTKPMGTGLGLPFCKRAAEMHGGVIEIESAPDCGTVIKVFIPILPQSEPDLDQTQELFSN